MATFAVIALWAVGGGSISASVAAAQDEDAGVERVEAEAEGAGSGTAVGAGAAAGADSSAITSTPTTTTAATSTTTGSNEENSFSATARVQEKKPTVRQVENRVAREVPGTFGDPFRILDSLPGVIPVFSGLPYVYVRGAPPAGTVYYYDEIQVPALFHLALGPAVIHPAMIGDIDFYPSVAPARYGRFTGGVLSGRGCESPCARELQGEVELRTIDAMGMIKTPIGQGGSLSVAGRYGYPNLLLSVLSPNSTLNYWDYQTKLELPLDDRDRFELVWFGAADHGGEKNSTEPGNALSLEFHRLEARLIRKIGRFEYAAMLQGGYEHSSLDKEFEVSALRLGPRAYVSYRGDDGLRLRFGMDFFGSTGSLRDPRPKDDYAVDYLNPEYSSVAARSTGGVYGELHLPLDTRLALDAGLRSDLWMTGSRAMAAVEPRLALSYHLLEPLTLHIAAGLGHQPAVFLIPLPGIADVALDRGLQSAIQSEAGAAYELGEGFRLESQVYLQRFTDMILPESVLDSQNTCGDLPMGADGLFGCNLKQFPRSSVWAYGLEVFLRRDASRNLSGWLSYTLGWASAESNAGFAFTPAFDIRHVLNFVLQYRIGSHFSVGGRLHYRSGRVLSYTFVRDELIHYQQRLPGFFRADAEVAYAWFTGWGRMRIALEWLNVTMSREASSIECRDGVQTGSNPLTATPCPVRYAPPIFFPNLGARAEF